MDGIFIDCSPRPGVSDLRRQLLQQLDVAFTHLLLVYLIVLYFTIMSHTIYKEHHEYEGAGDFYVEHRRT